MSWFRADNKWSKRAARERFYTLREAFPWYRDYSADIGQSCIDDLDRAFQNFFAGRARFPTFAKKGQRERFSIRLAPKIKLSGRYLKLEKMPQWLKLRERVRFSGRIKQANLSLTAGKWFVALVVETLDPGPAPVAGEGCLGVDVGCRLSNGGARRKLATTSRGKVYEVPAVLQQRLGELRRRARNLSRKVKGSKRYARAKVQLARLHHRIACMRQAVLHNVANDILSSCKTLVLEDLNLRGLAKGRLARHILDAGLGELRRILTYKADRAGVEIVLADRFFPSSKTCSSCGARNDLGSCETWTCRQCGASHDRDANAALNLERYDPTGFSGSDARRSRGRPDSSGGGVDDANTKPDRLLPGSTYV